MSNSRGHLAPSQLAERRRLAPRRMRAVVIGAGLVLFLLLSELPLSAGAAASAASSHRAAGLRTRVRINGKDGGSTFEGIGAISGGGGNSRLLIDYPPPERQEILDYLFKPDYGASLQLLKLEIGGDTNSSDGSEPSIEHSPGQVDCGAGYEFWLARQALALNPELKIYGLQWGAPAFVRGEANGLWSRQDISYLISWLNCARAQGVPVSYLGGWNEHYPAGSRSVEYWYEALRRALDENGYSNVEIVAADAPYTKKPSAWAVADNMAANPRFASAVSVIGVHDVCGRSSDGYHCRGAPAARRLADKADKLLWQSELGHTPANVRHPLRYGPGSLARSLNNAFIDAGITGTMIWPLVDSLPAYLPYENRGLVLAGQPWTGNFQVTPLTWVIAQTTQATAPGWRFIRRASGFLPQRSGSYVTYEAPDRSAWSTVVQTSTAKKTVRVSFALKGLPTKRIEVWRSSLMDGSYFAHLRNLRARGGRFSFKVEPGRLYTFTTLTTLSKAGGKRLSVPRSAAEPLPYSVRTDQAGMPEGLSPMEGSFAASKGAIYQTAQGRPVQWLRTKTSFPYAVVGSRQWTDYTVSSDVTLPTPSSASSPPPAALLLARFQGYSLQRGACSFSGYELSVDSTGFWQLLQKGRTQTVVLEEGFVPARSKFNMSLTVQGDQLTASIGGLLVASVTSSRYTGGLAGLGTSLYDGVRFDNFSVRATGS